MKGNYNYSVEDSDRDFIANVLDGKETRRMATRKEICAMLEGCLDAACDAGVNFEITKELESRPDAPAVATVRREFDPAKVPPEYRNKPLQWQRSWYVGRYVLKAYHQ